jgi:putative transposase
MDGTVWRPAHLTPEQFEERRLAAAALLHQGRLSQAEIARQLGSAAPVSAAGPPRWPSRAGADWSPAAEQGDHSGSIPATGFVWVSSWTGARWRWALPPSAGPSNALPP